MIRSDTSTATRCLRQPSGDLGESVRSISKENRRPSFSNVAEVIVFEDNDEVMASYLPEGDVGAASPTSATADGYPVVDAAFDEEACDEEAVRFRNSGECRRIKRSATPHIVSESPPTVLPTPTRSRLWLRRRSASAELTAPHRETSGESMADCSSEVSVCSSEVSTDSSWSNCSEGSKIQRP